MNFRSDAPSGGNDSGQKGPTCMLKAPLPLLNDPEGQYLPAGLPFTVDAHVHFFPDHLFSAVWQWFEQFGWPIRYRLTSPEIINSTYSPKKRLKPKCGTGNFLINMQDRSAILKFNLIGSNSKILL